MKKILSIGLVLALSATVFAAHSVNGVIADGEWARTVTDLNDVSTANTEMVRWGAEVEGGYLYWFCELSATDGKKWTDFQGDSKMIFPGLWIDADASTSTYIRDGGDANCADHSKFEWATNHRGIDLNVELGLVGNWTNGSLTGPSGEGTGGSMYNGWGKAGDVGDYILDPITEGASWYVTDYVMEARISLSELAGLVAASNNATVGDYMMVAVGVQGFNNAGVTWGYDVGTPIAIAKDPVNKPLVVGDANLNGYVDDDDLSLLLANWNTASPATWKMGDFDNADTDVDDDDLSLLLANWNQGTPPAGAVSVPEPATMSLLGVGILALVRRKK